ncbi:hypothetical protein ILYODFUR_037532 [Ilyodon furcidens]|uniref:Uncharacterized protein n=1 Tax=Ilyodon furcidens TaxID=33524 RepID=A0ABV0TEB3_9TELE
MLKLGHHLRTKEKEKLLPTTLILPTSISEEGLASPAKSLPLWLEEPVSCCRCLGPCLALFISFHKINLLKLCPEFVVVFSSEFKETLHYDTQDQ